MDKIRELKAEVRRRNARAGQGRHRPAVRIPVVVPLPRLADRRLRKKTKLSWSEIVSRMRRNSAYKSRMARISDKTWIRYAS